MENTLRYSPNVVFIRKSELATAYSFAKTNWLPPIHSQKRIGYRLFIRKSELATAYHSQKRIGYRLSIAKANWLPPILEPLVGFEPTTPRLQITCSGQLS